MRSLLAMLTLLLGPLAGAQPADLPYTLEGEGRIIVELRYRDGPAGIRHLEGSLRNTGPTDATFDRLIIDVPWLAQPGAGLLVAAGPATMVSSLRISALGDGTPAPTSAAYLQARQGDRYALLAIVTGNTFWTRLTCAANGRVAVEIDGEGRRLRPGETVSLETLRLAEGDDWQQQLHDYATELAAARPAPLKPRRVFVGWSTWDYYGRTWRAETLRDHLAQLPRIEPRANLLQIDGGWWPSRGDYTTMRPDLAAAGGMAAFAAEARAAGLTAGLHFDGARGDDRSAIYRAHREYFLHDDRGALVARAQRQAGEELRHVFFDYSHPGTLAYLREVTRTMRHAWGYDYLKVDFLIHNLAWHLRQGGILPAGRRLAPHDPGTTSVERQHLALRAMREGMGDDAWFLGCNPAFNLVAGYFDSFRSSFDIWPNFPQFRINVLANSAAFALHGRIAWADADYQVARSRADQDHTLVPDPTKDAGDLSTAEVAMLTHYLGLFSTAKLNSDNLTILRPERRALFNLMVDLPACERFVPVDLWQHARNPEDACNLMLGEAGGVCHLAVFNWGDEPRTFTVHGLGGFAPGLLAGEARAATDTTGAWQITLAGRHSAVFRLPAGAGYDQLRRTLRIE